MALTGRPPALVSLLDVDAELCDALPTDDVATARTVTRVPAYRIEPGAWHPPQDLAASGHFIGLLVLEGLLSRDVTVAGMGCTELMGSGDLLRPSEQDAAFPSVPFEVAFRVEQPTQVAVLSDRFAAAARRWPQLYAELTRRMVRRSQSMAMHLAITCITGTDVRLRVLLWHLADRWGHVSGGGVVLPVPLTHETLGRLVRGGRPAISKALRSLAERDLVHRHADGWLLCGGPPDSETVAARGGARRAPDDDR